MIVARASLEMAIGYARSQETLTGSPARPAAKLAADELDSQWNHADFADILEARLSEAQTVILRAPARKRV